MEKQDIQWAELTLPSGGHIQVCTIEEASVYLDMHEGILVSTLKQRRVPRYVSRQDLDKIRNAGEEMTVDDIQWVTLPLPDGGRAEACTVKEAQVYLGVNPSAITKILKRHNITRYQTGIGTVRYILRRDLDPLLEAHPVED